MEPRYRSTLYSLCIANASKTASTALEKGLSWKVNMTCEDANRTRASMALLGDSMSTHASERIISKDPLSPSEAAGTHQAQMRAAGTTPARRRAAGLGTVFRLVNVKTMQGSSRI